MQPDETGPAGNKLLKKMPTQPGREFADNPGGMQPEDS
jgi:hypothetical protein